MRGKDFGAMIITHYQRLLNYITPDLVHVMMDGRIVLSGDAALATRLEKKATQVLHRIWESSIRKKVKFLETITLAFYKKLGDVLYTQPI